MSTKKPKTHYNYQTINGQQRYVGPDSPYRTVRPPRSVREGTTIKVGSRVRLKDQKEARGVMKEFKDKVMIVTDIYGTYCDITGPGDIRGVVRIGLEQSRLELAIKYFGKGVI
jgi:hypothetical protein